jgi:hypothetical protein
VSKTDDRRLELLLAGLLRWGTCLASAMIGTGLAMTLSGAEGPIGLTGMGIVTAGIAFFIFLPVLRVLLMLGVFVRQRDYRLVVVALGMCLSNSPALAH